MTEPGWKHSLPPFLVGAALAVTGEVAAGLLLYDGPGFLSALSVLLAVLLAALGLGVLGGLRRGVPGLPGSEGRVRSIWLRGLLAALGAMIFAAAWDVFEGFGATALSQTAGLVVLGALPYYAAGAVLGMISAGGGSAPGYAHPGVATPLGGAAGVLAVGFLLFPAASPTTMLFGCVLGLALAAQIHLGIVERSAAPRDEETVSA